MDNKTRRTRFEGRVNIEREFLTPVNKVFGSRAPLAGMTLEAISSWGKRASKYTSENKVGEIVDILREAAVKAALFADNSRDVFEPSQRNDLHSVQRLHKLLSDLLQNVQLR